MEVDPPGSADRSDPQKPAEPGLHGGTSTSGQHGGAHAQPGQRSSRRAAREEEWWHSDDSASSGSDEEDPQRLAQRVAAQPDPLYDPDADARDDVWMEQQRQGRQTDALLSCPGCFTSVCIDCQQVWLGARARLGAAPWGWLARRVQQPLQFLMAAGWVGGAQCWIQPRASSHSAIRSITPG